MIKITVISDSHGNVLALDKMAQIILESDYVFHLGDHFDDMRYLAPVLGDKLYRVHGNCDWGDKKDVVVRVGEKKIFATHGDLYGVKSGTNRLVQKAKEQGCSVALYGHTHVAEIREQNGVLLINPGTLHKLSARKTFAYVVVCGDKVIPTINDSFFEN
jgi:putative phosphoesterase